MSVKAILPVDQISSLLFKLAEIVVDEVKFMNKRAFRMKNLLNLQQRKRPVSTIVGAQLKGLTTTITSEMIDMFQLEVSIRSLRGASMADDSCRLAQALEPMALKVRSEDSVSVEDHQSEMRRERVKGTPLCHGANSIVNQLDATPEDSLDQEIEPSEGWMKIRQMSRLINLIMMMTRVSSKFILKIVSKRLVRMLNGNKHKQKKDHDVGHLSDEGFQLQRRIQRYSSEGTSNHSGLLVEEKEERERNVSLDDRVDNCTDRRGNTMI
ncbi:hypothetical protein PPACK8108_LOCUS493 [Phakopsora pachyrhizi]|uniref:Uncharacterized protein n=1 Tax=Phakopsora pachyrhizi TaxID=170000 RepID=A0AAV0AHF5_PHAPC|nr:hypothetical protein PPACK8108_LOCUS493 [Phakopsora pachyrhizi]